MLNMDFKTDDMPWNEIACGRLQNSRKAAQTPKYLFKDLIKVLHFNLRILDNKLRLSGQKSAWKQQCIPRGVMCVTFFEAELLLEIEVDLNANKAWENVLTTFLRVVWEEMYIYLDTDKSFSFSLQLNIKQHDAKELNPAKNNLNISNSLQPTFQLFKQSSTFLIALVLKTLECTHGGKRAEPSHHCLFHWRFFFFGKHWT